MRSIILILVALIFLPFAARGQIGISHPTIESQVAKSDLVVRGTISKIEPHEKADPKKWRVLTITVTDVIKGAPCKEVRLMKKIREDDKRWAQYQEAKQDQLWFLRKSSSKRPGDIPGDQTILALQEYKPLLPWPRMRLGPPVADERKWGDPLTAILSMKFELLNTAESIVSGARHASETEPDQPGPMWSMMIPGIVAMQTERKGDANSLTLPGDARLEATARFLITEPEKALPKPRNPADASEANWRNFMTERLRAEGARALERFKSPKNIALLKPLLESSAQVGQAGLEEKKYYVRIAAVDVLSAWKVEFEQPVLVTGRDARMPANDADLRFWLENMIWYHEFAVHEVAAATGLSHEQIESAQERFKIHRRASPRRAKNAPLLVLPYPGGRHPRIGFLEGAVKPQRETKISVFTPWHDSGYVVVDVPEAIWSNLGLTYLAHTHVPTVWTKQNIELPKLEWNRRQDGTLDHQRKLPNGIEFGTRITPTQEAVHMELWLKNGSNETLSDLRVQNCVMLKNAHGFSLQTSENKVFKKPYVAVHDDDKKRWVITAWDPCHRPWDNKDCPCMHSDPKFPDCAPGETKHLRGWLSFYEGKDLDAEIQRIEKTGWRTRKLQQTSSK